MSSKVLGEFEYAPFGDGFVKRPAKGGEWEPCKMTEATDAGYFSRSRPDDDAGGLPDGAVPYRTTAAAKGETSRAGAALLPNPVVDEVAAELGLDSIELRKRLQGKAFPGGTNTRVSEARFDELVAKLGLEPQDARDRLGDRK